MLLRERPGPRRRNGWIDDVEVGDGGDARRHVVARDHLLRRNLLGNRSQAHAYQAVDERNQQHHAGSLLIEQAPETEDDAALVLAQDAN